MSVSLHLITARLLFHFHHAIISLARSLSAICSVALSCFSISSSDLCAVSRVKHPKGLRHSVGWEDSQHSPRHVPGPISLDRGSLHSVRAAALYVVLSEGCVCVCVCVCVCDWHSCYLGKCADRQIQQIQRLIIWRVDTSFWYPEPTKQSQQEFALSVGLHFICPTEPPHFFVKSLFN